MSVSGVTQRQYAALRMYYVDGLSYRRIGNALMIDGKTAYDLVCRGRDSLIRYCVNGGDPPTKRVLVGGLVSSGPPRTHACDAGLAASRRDELLDALELRMEQRASELESIEDCMCGSSTPPTHVKRNQHDRWEIVIMNERTIRSLPTTAYEARVLHRFKP